MQRPSFRKYSKYLQCKTMFSLVIFVIKLWFWIESIWNLKFQQNWKIILNFEQHPEWAKQKLVGFLCAVWKSELSVLSGISHNGNQKLGENSSNWKFDRCSLEIFSSSCCCIRMHISRFININVMHLNYCNLFFLVFKQ